mgnify:CR=1
MSPIAYALFQYVRRQPAGANLVMEDMTSDLRASKTAIRSAFAELQSANLLTFTQES